MKKIRLAIYRYLSWKILQDLNRLGGGVLYRYEDQIHDYTYKKFEKLIYGDRPHPNYTYRVDYRSPHEEQQQDTQATTT